MLRTADASMPPREHVTTAGSVKSLVAVVMLVATILMVLFDSAALITVWQGPIAYPGVQLTTRGSDVLIGEVTDQAVSRLGVRPGQVVRWQGRSEWRAAFPRAGDAISGATPSGPVVLRALHQPMTTALMVVAFASILGALTVLVLTGVLCYKKPGVMTVSLWLFLAANFNVGWLLAAYGQLPEPIARPTCLFILAVLGAWSFYALVWFALRFPNDRITTRSMRVVDYAWTIISVIALVWFLAGYSGLTFGIINGSYENEFWRYTVPQNIPLPVGLAVFLWVYARAGETERQRALWAIVGFVLLIVFEAVGNFASENGSALYFVGNLALMLTAYCPLAMLYSVLRHHLLDISFVVNRALVYSVLTAGIVLIVGFVDWLAGKYLFESRAALAVEAIVIVGLGFVLQRLHSVLESVVDRVIFASRHAAERHIDRVVKGLAFATTHKAILQALVDTPHAALDVVSCAVFIEDGGPLVLCAHLGWRPAPDASIARDDALARLLLSERQVIDIADVHWRPTVAGLDGAALDIAIPLFSRNDLLGVALYGRHRNGSTIDPEERRLLRGLCAAAAVAYNAVALAETRQELAALKSGSATAQFADA
jgi:hypothetical protein